MPRDMQRPNDFVSPCGEYSSPSPTSVHQHARACTACRLVLLEHEVERLHATLDRVEGELARVRAMSGSTDEY